MQLAGRLKEKIKSFGWNAYQIDGHDLNQIETTIKNNRNNKPTCIILDTIKGKGISFMETPEWHAKAPNKEEYYQSLKELGYESNT